LLGKTTTQEFAAGVISAPARNPWDLERIPGGSSGGSAAAVAVGSCFGAMGSDTGGSIRIPAAACGVVGFKPAFGQLEFSGVFPLSWSLDTVGPIARTVEDAWILWRSLQGLDAWPGERFNDDTDLEGIRVGIADGYFLDSLQPEVRIAVQTTAHRLEELGAEIVSASWADAAAARAAAFIINRVETAAVHGRVAVDHPDQFRLYGPDLRLRVAAGLAVPAASYIAAVRAREIIKKSVAAHFAKHRIHVLLAPTLPTTAVDAADLAIHGTGLDEGIGAAWTRLTMPLNATGQPVLALPAALDGRNLPIGIQLAGRPNDEETLFCIGHRLERAIGFAQRTGPLLAKISCDHAKESPSELTR
jgi:aspartyl-tRNA(Asn)/glutamyl-tRNA(Gln) amidotransferase subunit A